MKTKKIKVQINLKITPPFFCDLETEINKQLSLFLFTYTFKLSGIPICYKIIGIYPVGHIICDNEGVFVKTIIEFYVLSFKIGDILQSQEGVTFGIVNAKVNEEDVYTGRYEVIDVETVKGECSNIIGVPINKI